MGFYLRAFLVALSITVLSTDALQSREEEYLDKTNLNDVLTALREHYYEETRWRELCLSLGLYVTTVDKTEADYHGLGVNRCLQDCLGHWLSQADDVNKRGGPTWHSLITALRSIQETATANGIDKKKHPACKILDHYTSNPSIYEPISNLATSLYKEKVVSQMIPRSSRRGQLLLEQVKKAVCDDYQILEKFAVILQQSSSTTETGKAIMNEYRNLFQIYEMTTTNSKAKSIYLDTSADLNFTELRTEFAGAIYDVYDAMNDAPRPSLRDLMNYLRWGFKYLRPQLRHCRNRADVLDLISNYSSMINIDLLEAIVNKFHIEAAKPVIQKYKKSIIKIRQSILHRVLNQNFYPGSPLQSETIKIHVNQDVNSCTFNDVQQLIKAAFKELEPCVRIVVIREGSSYIVTCSFPLLLSEELISTALDNIEALKKKGLQRLTIGFSTVYDEVCNQEKAHVEDLEHCPSVYTSTGTLEQMAVYMSVKQLNNEDEDEIAYTETGTDTTLSAWLSILFLLSVITTYVLIEQVFIIKNNSNQGVMQSNSKPIPRTWRHYKRGRKELIIIGSFGNHEDWPLAQHITVSPKLMPDTLEGTYDEGIKEEVERIKEVYRKNPKDYDLKFIYRDVPGMEQSREYYLEKIAKFFENCQKDEALIYYTGHGEKDTGNWCFKDGVITFKDIFNLYMEHLRGKSLQIITDCSYSGNWIKECAKKLDECGILSCGHHTREQSILLKIFTSCQPNEEAILLTFCRRGIRYSEVNKGVVVTYDEVIKPGENQAQYSLYTDFRHIQCNKRPEQQCELDSTCTWEDRIGNKKRQIFLVNNEHKSFSSWYYVLVYEDKINDFKASKNIEVGAAADYGKVLYSGPGANPPKDVEEKINLRFMLH